MSAFFTADALDLSYANGTAALSGVSLTIEHGEFVALVGPSGCGKSTLLKIAAGLLQPTGGRASRNVGRTGFVFQFPTLLPWRTVSENVALPLELSGTDVSPVPDALKRVGLSDFAHAFPNQLSGGMQMRTSVARALVTQPDFLLLDEPFGALDEITRQRLNEELLSLWERDRWAALFVTHNVSEAVFLSQRVLVMSGRPGRIVENVEVPFDYPRSPVLRADPGFAALCGRISAKLREVAG